MQEKWGEIPLGSVKKDEFNRCKTVSYIDQCRGRQDFIQRDFISGWLSF